MRIQHLYNLNRYADVSKQQWEANQRFKLYWRIVDSENENDEKEKEKQKKIKIPKEVEVNEEDN